MIQFKGKVLVRRSKTHDGKPCLCITGLVIPNTPIEEFDERDEMWAVHLAVLDHKAMVNTNTIHFSPEDFLENECDIQNKEKWTPKV